MSARALLAGLLCAALAMGAGAAGAQDADWASRVAEAARAAQAAKGRDARLRALSALILAQETAQAALRRDLRVMTAIETAARDRLAARDGEIAGLLLTLQRQGQAAALPFLHPQGPLAAARVAGLNEAMIGALESARRALAADLERVAQARGQLDAAVADLAVLRQDAVAARQALIAVAAARGDLPPAYDSAAAVALAQRLDAQDIPALTAGLRDRPGGAAEALSPGNIRRARHGAAHCGSAAGLWQWLAVAGGAGRAGARSRGGDTVVFRAFARASSGAGSGAGAGADTGAGRSWTGAAGQRCTGVCRDASGLPARGPRG